MGRSKKGQQGQVQKDKTTQENQESSTSGSSGCIPQQISQQVVKQDTSNPKPVEMSTKAGQQSGPEMKSEQPSGSGEPPKTKAQLKAERRAKQEAQRAAKAAKQGGDKVNKDGGTKTPAAESSKKQEPQVAGREQAKRVPDSMQMDTAIARKRMSKKLEKQNVPQRPDSQRKVALFSHLDQYERATELTKDIQFSSTSRIHPAIVKLGLQYANGIICGSNARCLALLAALKKVICDYSTPPQKELSRDLDAKIKPCISFLKQCRPLSVSMGNAIKYIKWHINHIPQDMKDNEAKEKLNDAIDDFWKEKIKLAGKAIAETFASSKITDGDVIMVYACSSLIRRVLCYAHDIGKKFSVIVVDGRPKLEGREMLKQLVQHGIQCSYVLINAVPYIIKEVSKVFLGAHALLANGYVMSRVGSSQVALIARYSNVPVLVCCETYKFCERVQTDSFVFNELGDPNDLVDTDQINNNHLSGWRDNKNLNLLNLMYDVTPPELITMVITELGMVPCTSVPVVLRVKQTETEN